MAIDPSLFGQTVSIPSANSMLNPAPAASSYSSVHSSLSGLPSPTTLSQVPLPSSFTTGTGTGGTGSTGSGTSGSGGPAPVSPYASDVTDADVQAMTSSMTSLQGVYASGDLANLSSVTTSMTSQVVGQTPAIPSGWFSQVGTTSSLTPTMGTPNALSLLSSQQASQSLANQIQGNSSNSQTCGIGASITGAVSQMQNGLTSLYKGASSDFQAVEKTIGSTVSSAASMVMGLISGSSGGSGGSGGTVTKAQVNSTTSSISSAFSTISSEVTSAVKTVVGTVDGMAVSIENQIKLGVANAMNAINGDACFGSLGKQMTGSSLGSVISAQTGINTAKAQAAAQQAQQKQNANICLATAYDYPAATTQNLSDMNSQMSQANSDLTFFTNNLTSAQTTLANYINSIGYQQIKNNQTQSAAALQAYQTAKTQLYASPPYTAYQAANNAANAQSQVVSTLRSLANFMNTKGQLPSNPNGPWYTAANQATNTPGTVNGKLP